MAGYLRLVWVSGGAVSRDRLPGQQCGPPPLRGGPGHTPLSKLFLVPAAALRSRSLDFVGCGVDGRAPISKERLKLFKGGDREAAARFNPVKELAVVCDDSCQSSFRHPACLTKSGRVLQQLFLEGRITCDLVHAMNNAGIIPHLSTGNFPHGKISGLRDNSGAMGETLADRIRQRLDALGYTANAASQKAKLDRDYIGDMLKLFDDGKTQNPRTDTIQKLAYGLSCDPYWLATGKTPAAEDDQIQEAISLMADLPDDQRENALVILRALHDRTRSKQTG